MITASNGTWVLSGESDGGDDEGIAGSAICANWSDLNGGTPGTLSGNVFSGCSSATPCSQDVVLEDNTWMCMLTGIQGVLGDCPPGFCGGANQVAQVYFDGAALLWHNYTANGADDLDWLETTADCAQMTARGALNFGPAYVWDAGQPNVDMGPITGQVCMLEEVSGEFVESDDEAYLSPCAGPICPQHDWILGGHHDITGEPIEARARCLPIPVQ
jgi:hypothetical protein